MAEAAIYMVRQMKLPNGTQDLHLRIKLSIVGDISKSMFEIYEILAHDIIYDQSFGEFTTVEIQGIADRIINIHFSTMII